NGAGVNDTVRSVIPSLIWKGTHPEEIFNQVFAALKQVAERDGAEWDMAKEAAHTYKRIQSAYQNLFEKEYDPAGGIPMWLPMEFHEAWAAALAAGKRPVMSRNGSGWYTVRDSVVELTKGHLEKFFSPSRCESDSLTAMGHGRMERASHGADGLFRC